eukprot:6460075-Amphidinium_carterae.2
MTALYCRHMQAELLKCEPSWISLVHGSPWMGCPLGPWVSHGWGTIRILSMDGVPMHGVPIGMGTMRAHEQGAWQSWAC